MKFTRANHERGYATLLMVGFLALLLVVLAANTASVNHVQIDLKRIDREQKQHWENLHPTENTNRVTRPRPWPER